MNPDPDVEMVPQPSEWMTLDDVVAWAEAAARAGNLYIAEDLRRVASRISSRLTELEAEVERSAGPLRTALAKEGPHCSGRHWSASWAASERASRRRSRPLYPGAGAFARDANPKPRRGGSHEPRP